MKVQITKNEDPTHPLAVNEKPIHPLAVLVMVFALTAFILVLSLGLSFMSAESLVQTEQDITTSFQYIEEDVCPGTFVGSYDGDYVISYVNTSGTGVIRRYSRSNVLEEIRIEGIGCGP